MPESETALQKNDETHRNLVSAMDLLRWLLASPKQTRRLAQWTLMGAVVTSALGAVANHFVSGTTSNQDSQKPVQNPSNSAWNGHQSNWWSGADSPDDASANNPVAPTYSPNHGDHSVSTSPANPPASNSAPAPHFSSGSVFLRDSLSPIGSNPAPVFAFAGPSWMKIAPLANATRPTSNQASVSSGKFAKKNQSAWQSPVQVNLNTATSSNQNSKNGKDAASNGTGTSSPGGRGIPVNHGYQLAGGELFLNGNQTPAGAKSSEPAYALLGLATGSTPQSSSTDTSSGELHFSLAGETTTSPTLGISDTPVANTSPEPTTGVMVVAGAAMLLSRRRRRSPVA